MHEVSTQALKREPFLEEDQEDAARPRSSDAAIVGAPRVLRELRDLRRLMEDVHENTEETLKYLRVDRT